MAKKTKKAAKKAVKKPVPKKAVKKKTAPRAAVRRLRDTAPAEKTTLDTLYVIDNSPNPVRVDIKVGAAGQTSNMTVKLDDTVLAQDISGNFPETVIGTNALLNGKKLTIAATIADTSRETNLTTLTILVKGGASDKEFPLAKTVNDEGDSADYLCHIEFFNPL